MNVVRTPLDNTITSSPGSSSGEPSLHRCPIYPSGMSGVHATALNHNMQLLGRLQPLLFDFLHQRGAIHCQKIGSTIFIPIKALQR